MNITFSPNPMLRAILGLLCIGLFFYFASQAKVVHLFHQSVAKEQILERAEDYFQRSDLREYDLGKKVRLRLEKNLSNYAQIFFHSDKPRAFFPLASWDVEWKGNIFSKKEGEQEVSYKVSFDLDGNLTGLSQNFPGLNRPPNFEESEAFHKAKAFLAATGVDSSAIQLRNKVINKDARVLNYDFVFSKASPLSTEFVEIYEVDISGRNISNYNARLSFESDEFILPNRYRVSETVAVVGAFAVWLYIGILILVHFIKRLRRDALEFKRAFWVALSAFALTCVYIGMQVESSWQERVFAGGLTGLFCALGMFSIFAVKDSFGREIWPEKAALSDVLFQGVFRVREFGIALLDSVAITGISLLFFGLLYWLAGLLHLGYFSFENEAFAIFSGPADLISLILKKLLGAMFIGYVLLGFWTTYLKSKIKHERILLLVLAIFFNLAGLQLYHLRPPYLAFVVFLPLALLWANFALRSNIISLLLALFLVNFSHQFLFASLLPDGYSATNVILLDTLIFTLLAGGAFFLWFSPLSVKDFKHYVPEYVSRIAERERFLQELEIARNVQQKFLPQGKPDFPHLDIACVCHPAMEVGGDYFDFIEYKQDTIGVLIGDVSGKGVSAAFYMTMVKGIIKTLAKQTDRPREILTRMNTIFYENAAKNVFISVIYGVFDMEKRLLTFARAGHNPLIICKHSSEKPEFITPRGMAIGLDSGELFSAAIEEVTLPVEAGDTFVFFTDGISESQNAEGDEFGEARLQAIIGRPSNGSAENLLSDITREIRHFSRDTQQHDDITMIVVRVRD